MRTNQIFFRRPIFSVRLLSVLSALPGVMLLAGCHTAAPTVLGTAPTTGDVVTVVQAARLTTNAPVTLQGEMIEKCPVAGCWFKLRDQTGVMRVDTKAAGFVVSDVPLHAQLRVQGQADAAGGVNATGVRY